METEETKQSPCEVFEGSAWEAGLLTSILRDQDVETYMTEAYSLPWNALPVKGGAAKVFVPYQDLAQAKAIVEEFLANMRKENPGEPEG